MRAIPIFRGHALACGCALALVSASAVAAQQRTQDQQSDMQGAKRSPGAAGAKETSRKKQSQKQATAVDHAALTRANQQALQQARALREQAGKEDAQLSKKMVTRRAKSIGKALDTARTQVALLAAGAPASDDALQENIEALRDKYESAAEHQRALLEETGQAQIDPDAIEQEAEAIASDLQEAEQAHRKIPGASAVHGPRGTGAAQNQPARSEVSTGRPHDGRTRERSAPKQGTPDSP